ncbi:PorT family protein [Hymenobacter sp. 15J16-1T3B]|uniref:porin family protein n=1 Tax=Hymenobacter sp. 15J16-1T3B TaxID=2886941 RepID=UPI001D101CEF|nr:porin family protein [Hymenobacter sp. 15J16-1T3B]MCC3155608.1 PorT family protein [Hymenobacter sp. 15J16-1T3B]
MKNAFLAAALLTGAALATAPAAHAQGVRIGIKAGANYSNIAGDVTDEDRFENKFGFHGGLLLNADLTGDGFFSIQPELLYSQKGYKNGDFQRTLGPLQYQFKGTVNYNYLDLPILAKINADGLFFELGPQFGYLLKIKDHTEFTSNVPGATYSSTSIQDLDNVNRFELGYAAGLGYQAESGPMIGLRYNGAFTDFAKDAYQSGSYKNARNSAFQLYLGYLFGGK